MELRGQDVARPLERRHERLVVLRGPPAVQRPDLLPRRDRIVEGDRERRVHHVGAHAVGGQHARQPLAQEVQHLGAGPLRGLALQPVSPAGLGDERRQGEPPAAVEEHGQHGDGLPPEAVGVLGPARDQPGGEAAGDRVDAVGDAHADSLERAREAVAGMPREIVLRHGLGHRRVLAREEGVLPPHDPLQLRELAHHAGQEVRLGQQGGPPRGPPVGAEQPGEMHGELLHPQGLVMETAEFLLEGDLPEFLHPVGKPLLHIMVVEIGRVREPGGQNPLVSRPDHLEVLGLRVADRDEVRQQVPFAIHDAEIPLVLAHGRDQHLFRHPQEVPGKASQHGHGVLHQVRDLIDETRVVQHPAAPLVRQFLGLLHDALLPHLGVDHHVVRLGLALVGLEILHQEGAGAHEPVAAREVAAPDAGQVKGDHLAAEEGQHPVDRPGEADILVHPAHGLGERDREDEARQRSGEPGRGIAALLIELSDHVLALVRGLHGQGPHVHSVLLGEDLGRPGRPSFRIEGHLLRRTEHLPGEVFLPLLEARGMQNQPARRAEAAHLAGDAHAARGEELKEEFLHLLERRRDEPRGDLLGAYFQKKLFRQDDLFRFRQALGVRGNASQYKQGLSFPNPQSAIRTPHSS